MTISYSWLKDYIKTDISAQEAAELLTSAGLEIESIETVEAIRGGLAGLVVGKVISCEKHPDADKLRVTTVDVGGETPLQIVCGAPNVAAGQTVVVATVGAKLYPSGAEEPFAIKKSKIRGIESLGMICAEDEIGVGESHDGIIVLEDKFEAGTEAATVFNLEAETIFEVGLTPNRVDAASHYGVARDLAASLTLKNEVEVKAILPSVSEFKEGSDKVEVRVENSEAAPRYMGVVMRDIKVALSPEWLQKYLRAIGINPKNNVVDITNFILHECGQPLHAFDLAKVKDETIVVRTAKEGTKFKTLDGVERTLAADDLMICNSQSEMCLAGVFGGEESGVSDSTTSVFIESAYFNPAFIRRSAKRHGLSTDSSWRYERGADPNMLPYALKRCAMLIEELAGGKVTSQVVDIYPNKIDNFKFKINLERINSLIGKEIPVQTIRTILTSLEIKINEENGSEFSIEIPPYRVDIQREADIAEEILRLFGFNNIENPPFIKNVLTVGNRPTTDKLVCTISDMMVSCGFTEIMSNSLTKATYYEGLTDYPIERSVKILNPLSSELSVMRQTLLFNALEAISLNAARKRNSLKMFEVGNCYFFNDKAQGESQLVKYTQSQRIGIAITGDNGVKTWNNGVKATSFFDLKAAIEAIFERFGLNFYEGTLTEGASQDIFTPNSATYTIRGGELFSIGEVKPQLVAKLEVKPVQTVYYAEINVEKLAKLVSSVKVKVTELTKFQPVKRDLALLVSTETSFATLREAAVKAEKKLLKQVSIFDVYQGDKLPKGKKSYALSFILEDTTKTLTDKDIERAMTNISTALSNLGAEVRS